MMNAGGQRREPAMAAKCRGGCLVKVMIFGVVLAAVGALAWMLLLPILVTAQIRARTGFEVSVASLSCNAFTGRLIMRGLVLGNPRTFPARDFVELQEFRAEAELGSLFSERLVLDALTVDFRKVMLVRRADGRTNAEVFRENLMGLPPQPPSQSQPQTAMLVSAPSVQSGEKSPPAITVTIPNSNSAPAQRLEPPTVAEAAPSNGSGPSAARPTVASEPERKFLVRRLTLRFNRLVLADYSGAIPKVEDYPLGLDQSYENVTDAKQLLVPEVLRRVAAANLGPALAWVPGDFGRTLRERARETVDGSAELLKGAEQRGADLFRGLREKLEENKKP